MIVETLAGTRTLSGEPPRSTAYYYADLERIKRQNGDASQNGRHEETRQNPDELSEYVEANDVINDGGIKEIPPFRDRLYSLPEYHTPENTRKLETYSTAGTFPMPEPKEKEPLLAELEIVGRVPLTQLDHSPGVRRSRSWYLCCPNVEDEEMSRESSWRYASLRPVTAPPIAGQNGVDALTVTEGSGRDDAVSLKAERDALARALAAERARAAAAARAQDARLAELHGVIAELVRRRAGDRHTSAIPEEEPSDECESTTQPAGELEPDADRSRTDQNESSSILSGDEQTGEESRTEEIPDQCRDPTPRDCLQLQELVEGSSSLNLSDKEPDHSATPPRWHSGDSCERERGSSEGARVYSASPVCCEARKAKMAARVRLKKTEEDDSEKDVSNEERWRSAAERLSRDVSAQAALREALVLAAADDTPSSGEVRWWRARCARLESDCALLHMAVSRATDTAHRYSCACAVQESACVALCGALRAADRALEAYDVLLALGETRGARGEGRAAAEAVARQLLCRLDAERAGGAPGEPLLSPGPWLLHRTLDPGGSWGGDCEERLRSHAARLKAESVRLRSLAPPPALFSYHDIDDEELSKSQDAVSGADMEAAVMMQECLAAREKAALEALRREDAQSAINDNTKNRRRREKKQWHAETDL